ncbi:unnamed protein product, partial [Allacma fusca]
APSLRESVYYKRILRTI